MTTALQLIEDAFAQANLAETGQDLSAEDAALGLRTLNRLMGKWSNLRLFFPVLAEYSVPMTGAASYTIGPTGGVVGLRPLKVNSATATDAGGMEYPVKILTREQWDAISVKSVTGGPPSCIWYSADTTNGRVYAYPVSTGYTLKLDCQALLTSFASTATAFTLPDGYESALGLTLADSMAAAYGKQLPQDTRRRMAGAVSAIKRTNTEPLILAVCDSGQEYQIERGY